jgi:Ca2+-binding RTX toxin-like protein
MSRPRPAPQPQVEALEDRTLLANNNIVFDPVTRVITVTGTDRDDTVLVRFQDNNRNVAVSLQSTRDSAFQLIPFTQANGGRNVVQVRFNGFEGNDRFENQTTIPTDARGGLGDDTLIGGLAADVLRGDSGRDKLRGNAGNDSLLGGDGADTLIGGIGADTLRGGAGDDSLNGGLGADFLDGEDGNDRLDGSFDRFATARDTLRGGAGVDVAIRFQATVNGAVRFDEVLADAFESVVIYFPAAT